MVALSTLEPLLALKQGATLALDLFVTDDEGGAADLAAATPSLVLYDLYGNEIATLSPTLSATQGWASVSAATAAWPIGTLAGELQISTRGATQISDTFHVILQRPASA